MSRTLTVEVGRRSSWLHGPGVRDLLDAARITRRQYDTTRRCWSIAVVDSDDLLAYAEYRAGYRVEVTAVDR